jgi:hypothetical protein
VRGCDQGPKNVSQKWPGTWHAAAWDAGGTALGDIDVEQAAITNKAAA